MKARLSGVFLCVVAFVLSMVLLLHLIENPMVKEPVVGTDPDVQAPVGENEDETPQNNVSTDVTSIEGVMAVAKETQTFFDVFATDSAALSQDLSGMLQKWENAALYLKERAADTKGADFYIALGEAMRAYAEELPTDAASFSAQARSVLNAIDSAAVEEEKASGRYPDLSTEENGEVAMTLLRLWREAEREQGSVTVTFGGEIAMGDYIGADSYQNRYASDGAVSPLAGLVPVFATDDITIVSLAAPLTTYTVPEVAATEAFRGSSVDAYAKHLKNAGVDVVVLSTCHIRDFGETGYNDTKTALEKAGLTIAEDSVISYVDTTAGKVAVIAHDVSDDGDVRYSEVPKAKIAEAESTGAALVITYFHTADSEEMSVSLANTLRDAATNGSDLVLASHADHVQGILLGGNEGKTALVFSPGQLSYAARTEGGKNTFLYQQSFSVLEGQATAGERLIYAVNNHSTGTRPNFAPRFALSIKGAAAVKSSLSAALPNYAGRPASGDLTYITIEE